MIPKIIHQTYKDQNFTEGMKQAQQSWAVEDFTYNFYDDKQCLDFIKKHFTQKEVNAFIDLVPGAFKADLFRLCALYVHGGVYADIDTILLEDLKKLLDQNVNLIVCRDDPMAEKWLWNGFIAATPKHPALKIAIQKIISNVASRENRFYLEYTGPAMFGKAINQYLGRDIERDFKLGLDTTSNMLVVKHQNGHIIFDEKSYIQCEYPTKQQDNLPSYFWDNVEKHRIFRQIPRKIIYTALDSFSINEYMVDSFKKHNPDYELLFFDQYKVDKWFKQTPYNDFYLTLTDRGEISDFFRYCYLYENGGVYVDTDTFCNQPLDNWITYQDIIFGLEGNVVKEGFFKDNFFGIGYVVNRKILSVCNWTIACKKHHPLMLQIIEDIVNKPNKQGALVNTGPGRITKHVIDYFGIEQDYTKDVSKDNSMCLSINRFGSNQSHSNAFKTKDPFRVTREDVYITHMFEGTWRTKENKDIKKFDTLTRPSVTHNLTIFPYEDGYKGVSRYDENTERTLFMKEIGDCRSLTEYFLNKDFDVINSEVLPITGYSKKAKFEDFRHFSYRGKDYFCAAYVDEEFNTNMAILDDQYNFLGDVIIDQYNKMGFGVGPEVYFEKNWLFFEKDNELYFIYSTTPTLKIYKCEDWDTLYFKVHHEEDTDTKHNIPRDEMYFSKVTTGGSTSPITIDSKLVYMIHTKLYSERKYNHWLVMLDSDFNFIKISSVPFINKHIGYGLFFVMTMLDTQDTVTLSGGLEDFQNWVWQIPKSKLTQLLQV